MSISFAHVSNVNFISLNRLEHFLICFPCIKLSNYLLSYLFNRDY